MLDLVFQLLTAYYFSPDYSYWQAEEEATFLVQEIDPEEYETKVHCDTDEMKTVKSWREVLGAEVVINGGFFDIDQLPTGFTKAQNGTWGDPFDYPAVFYIQDREFQIRETGNWDPKKADLALASYPLLVKDQEANFSRETGKGARRTILGLRDNKLLLFITNSKPTLYESSFYLEDFGLELALNLDGGPSTGYSSSKKEIYSSVVNCVVAFYQKN
jgi:uncharacterized protein YigE (DUF2233 family)